MWDLGTQCSVGDSLWVVETSAFPYGRGLWEAACLHGKGTGLETFAEQHVCT